jgi:hypothetical protein
VFHANPRPAAVAATTRLPAVLGLGATGAAEATNLAPKNASAASMEGYNMEGTKKQVGGWCYGPAGMARLKVQGCLY